MKAIVDINCMQDETPSVIGLAGLNEVQKSMLEAADEFILESPPGNGLFGGGLLDKKY